MKLLATIIVLLGVVIKLSYSLPKEAESGIQEVDATPELSVVKDGRKEGISDPLHEKPIPHPTIADAKLRVVNEKKGSDGQAFEIILDEGKKVKNRPVLSSSKRKPGQRIERN